MEFVDVLELVCVVEEVVLAMSAPVDDTGEDVEEVELVELEVL